MEHLEAVYLHEVEDLITELESALLTIEEEKGDKEAIDQVFRAMHTLKGNSSMFGYKHIGELTHQVEDLYDSIRNEELVLDNIIFNITLESVDHIRNLLDDPELKNQSLLKSHEDLLERVGKLNIKNDSISKQSEQIKDSNTKPTTQKSTYYILFKPNKEILRNGTNPIYLLDELADLGDTKTNIITKHIPGLDHISPVDCYSYWYIFLSTDSPIDEIRDIFIFAEGESVIEIEKISDDNLLTNDLFIAEIERYATEQNDIDLDKIQAFTKTLFDRGENNLFDLNTNKNEQKISSIRVSSDKLDTLMNLVSEMVTAQDQLNLHSEKINDSGLSSLAEEIEKLSRQLRNNAMSICLVPFQSVVTRFKRIVRDLSDSLVKKINFQIEGAETELDKNIIDQIVDPVMHLLRNCIDHGIESENERISKGKPAKGTITLRVYHSGTSIHVQIQDDGRGLDLEKIKEKAVNAGIISASEKLSEKNYMDLIFRPGFTTATNVTNISGRGVGMDVVRQNIEKIRGEIRVNTEKGKGTTITLKLPLTLSIIDGLLVKIDQTKYVLPLSNAHKIYSVNHCELTGNMQDLITLEGKKVPFLYLREKFDLVESAPEMEQILVVDHEDKKVGLAVDEVIGEYQAVMKPLGKLYRHQEYLSGGTIMGDGTVALVLDPNKIINHFS